MPVKEGFVADVPKPLSVKAVVDTQVGVHWASFVVGIQACDRIGLVPLIIPKVLTSF